MGKIKDFISGSVLTVALFAVWQIAVKTNAIDSGILPTATDVLQRLWENAQSPEYWQKAFFLTVKRGMSGLSVSVAVGVLMGFSLATYLKKAKPYIMPLLQLFEKLNPIALFPLFMLFFGIGDESKAAIVFWVAVWQIAFHTLAGIENVDPDIIKSAKAMGTSDIAIFWKVLLPASLPEVYHGLKLGVQISFLFIVSVEMLSSSNLFPGLGGYIMESKKVWNLPSVYSGILLTALIGILLTKLLDMLGNRLFSWKQEAV
jgi:NitT/TauT family transport system permease protein